MATKRSPVIILAFCVCTALAGCAGGATAPTASSTDPAESSAIDAAVPAASSEATALTPGAAPVLADYPVSHDPEFGGVFIEIPIADFNALGFAFGDSVDIAFSNGYALEGLPYYSGYYGKLC